MIWKNKSNCLSRIRKQFFIVEASSFTNGYIEELRVSDVL